MKKRIVGHLGVVALALTLVSMTLMGGTVARYTTTVSGSAEATVAKFAFDLNGVEASTSTQTLDMSTLFKNSYGVGNEVVGSDSKKVIAPGTSGFIKIELKNESEVVIKPVFSVNVELADNIKASFPIEYAMSSSETAPTDEKEWGATDKWLPTDKNTNININASSTFYLHWRWKSDDTNDTAWGIKDTLDSIKVKIDCTVSQVLPTTTPAP